MLRRNDQIARRVPLAIVHRDDVPSFAQGI